MKGVEQIFERRDLFKFHGNGVLLMHDTRFPKVLGSKYIYTSSTFINLSNLIYLNLQCMLE